MRSSERFRALMKDMDLIQIPGSYDCITAKLVEKAGFPAVYLTGSGMSLALLGQPDLNTVSYLELRQIVENIRNAVNIPMLVDIDTGYGPPLSLIRLTLRLYRSKIRGCQKSAGMSLGESLSQKVKWYAAFVRFMKVVRKTGWLLSPELMQERATALKKRFVGQILI